ncbi:MAG: DUF805 domain-containing protein, partial [Holophagaceae bacterium]
EFDGRESRSAYWWWVLFVILVSAAVETISNPLSDVLNIALLLPNISSAVRRMHDVDKSGWYLLIPVYNIILLCQKGTVGENRFGTAPLS